jgi:hypothetical protein
MLHSLRLRVLGLLILGACVLALPAGASAAERWQRIADPAPGGQTGFDDPDQSHTVAAVAGDTAYLATIGTDGSITVYRARPRDTSWREVGLRRRNPSAPTAGFSMDTTGHTAWLAWYEQGSDSLWRVHLAESSGGSFREVAVGSTGSPDPGQHIDIVGYRGRVYVASTGSVARLSRNGRRLEEFSDGLDLVNAGQPVLVVSGDSLYAVQGRGSTSSDFQTIIARLNPRTDSWQRVAKANGHLSDAAGGAGAVCAVVDLGVSCITGTALTPLPDPGWAIEQVQIVRGVIYAAGRETPFAEAPAELKIFAFVNGTWRQLPDPIAPDRDTSQFDLLDNVDTLWLQWESSPNGPFSFPVTAHVARLLR